jgi:regulatory protein
MKKRYEDACYVESNGFTWQVLFPSVQSSSLGSSKPKAKVLVDGETLTIPVQIAKKLCDSVSNEGFSPDDRRELVTKIKDISLVSAKSKVIKLASQREYSSAELGQKLARDGYWKQTVEEAVEAARNGNVVSDERFTDIFIRSKLSAGWGVRKIGYELERKGIDPDTIPGWPDAYLEGEDEADRAYDLIAMKSVPAKNPYEKFVRFLVSKGYSYQVAKDAASRRCAEDGDF